MSIGELARAAGVSSRTIRYYEELGIIPPPPRSPGGTRKYPPEFRGYVEGALALKELGFSLEELKPLSRLTLGRPMTPAQRSEAAEVLDARIRVLDRRVGVLRRLRASLDTGEPVPLAEIIGSTAP